jgi:autotransporter-associated beta strand protein
MPVGNAGWGGEVKRVGVVACAVLGLGVGLAPTFASAQSVEIPLNYTLNTGSNFGSAIPDPYLILTINVGVNGGAAQPYAFDTGSAVFLTPSGVFTGATTLASGVNIDTYGGVAAFSGNVYQTGVSSLKFYATPGATSGGVSLGSSGNYNVASYTLLNGSTPPSQPFGTAAVGVFGADAQAFTVGGTSAVVGGIFGQTVVPGTTAGFVVSANGQSLAALNAQLGANIAGGPVGSGQQSIQTVPQSITSCNPCVTVGLTPALIAQFLPLNTVSAAPSGMAFPNSNIPGMQKFVPFNFTLTSGSHFQSFQNSVSLDTGWPDIKLTYNHPGNFTDPVLTISANPGGTQESFNTFSSGAVAPYRLTNGNTFVGIGFFVQNSVLFDLTGQQVGFSQNFVTSANITTTPASPLIIDSNSVPLGLAGVISGGGPVEVVNGGSATLSGTNTYSGATIINNGYLALAGPGSIAASSGVSVSNGGMFDLSNANSTVVIKSLSGDSNGIVALGPTNLALSNASGSFAGLIFGSGGLTLLSGNETLSGINGYTGVTQVEGGTLTVNGSIGSSSQTIVGRGAVLTGTGMVGPLTVMSGGTFAPAWGAPGASMTVAGDLSLSPGAIYAAQLGSNTAPLANISGNASLAGRIARRRSRRRSWCRRRSGG